ncbi:MAG: type II toxin-antitoxin system RelE/ParE family toxin [Phycisphaerales bacterium]|nr:type II toxin-antitoxin system RelE/ParE family toxin [Phycisphaerales bacterium]
MRYRVIFSPQADRDLVDLWLESDEQRAITEAVDDLVRRLEANPMQVGESRREMRRIALQWPVGIEFDINESSQEVHIYRFWTFKRRRA